MGQLKGTLSDRTRRGARLAAAVLAAAAALSTLGCSGGEASGNRRVIRNCGSDTLVNLAQMWADEYHGVARDVSVEVAGGGSGIGLRDLSQGLIDIANASRPMTASEKAMTEKNTGKAPVEWIVAYDALAIYVHRKNPIARLTFGQLAEIFVEGGGIDRWSQLGVDMKALGASDRIVRVNRQNSSGTYAYFRKVVLKDRDFELGSNDMSGSKDLVDLVGKTVGAIGYSGMGYATDAVRMVPVSRSDEGEAFAPSLESIGSGSYVLSRSLFMYTLGQPEGHVKAYLEWILSPAGQETVSTAGYVPVSMAKKETE